MPPHLDNRDRAPPHPPSRRVVKLLFFPLNMTNALSKKEERAVDDPRSGRQSIDVGIPRMKGKRAFGAPNMNYNSIDLPREGKKGRKNLNINPI